MGEITQRYAPSVLQAELLKAIAQRVPGDAEALSGLGLVSGRLAHLALEIAVRGGDDAHVHLALAHATDAPDGALLDRPQQLALHGEIDVADLVEEQKSALGRLDQTGLRFLGIRERAALVTEQLGLHEGGREGGTVHFDKWLRRARAGGVDGVREDALPGARLARQQHRWRVFQGGDLTRPLEHRTDGG